MAIVFVSPKQRQKIFLISIVAGLVIFLLLVTLAVFLARPRAVSKIELYQTPNITIDFSVFDQEQLKSSDILGKIPLEFTYVAKTKLGFQTKGTVIAPTEEEALKMLAEKEISDITLSGPLVGRENPFVSYYTSSSVNTTKKTK